MDPYSINKLKHAHMNGALFYHPSKNSFYKVVKFKNKNSEVDLEIVILDNEEEINLFDVDITLFCAMIHMKFLGNDLFDYHTLQLGK